MPTLSELGEFGLIARLARSLEPATPAAGAVDLGIGDDAALLRLPVGSQLVATIDALTEGVHFRRDWSRAEDVGWKSLAVNVSDLGAMGARPVGALITLAVPPDTPVRWIDRLYAGLGECATKFSCPIVGGDTVRSPSGISISVAALGAVPEGKAVRRSGARVGDLVCVTGTLGRSAAGLALLQSDLKPTQEERTSLVGAHCRPAPPIEAGARLAEAPLATAMLDLSDGLASDIQHIAKCSGVGAVIEAERLPISDAARQLARRLGVDPVQWALHGGEDYELLFTVAPERFPEVPPLLAPLGVTATIVGRITRRGVKLVTEDETVPLRPQGFAHFRTGNGRAR